MTLAELSMDEELALTAAWSPSPGWRWRTWGEYLDTYEAVRDELRAEQAHCPEPLFAEVVRRYRDAHGAAALLGAEYADIKAFAGEQQR